MLERVQNELFDVGADLSVPIEREARLRVTQSQVDALERDCDRFNESLPELKSFVLPGGTETAARLHVARAICRRAEREAIAAAGAVGVDPTRARLPEPSLRPPLHPRACGERRCRPGRAAVEAWELGLAFVGSFVAGYLGSMLGLVLGTLRLPLIVLATGSPLTAAGTNIAISAAAAAGRRARSTRARGAWTGASSPGPLRPRSSARSRARSSRTTSRRPCSTALIAARARVERGRPRAAADRAARRASGSASGAAACSPSFVGAARRRGGRHPRDPPHARARALGRPGRAQRGGDEPRGRVPARGRGLRHARRRRRGHRLGNPRRRPRGRDSRRLARSARDRALLRERAPARARRRPRRWSASRSPCRRSL